MMVGGMMVGGMMVGGMMGEMMGRGRDDGEREG